MGIKDMARPLASRAMGLLPLPVRQVVRAGWNFEHGYGHYRTLLNHAPTDAAGLPIPWYTYPALEYLTQLDFSESVVFEYGSGNSTLFWGARCKRLFAVEDDQAWSTQIGPKMSANTTYLFEGDPDAYVRSIEKPGEKFDCIIVDGSVRKRCGKKALEFLKPGGLIILDNSDWFPNTAEILRGAGLIQVDMHGFGPIVDFTTTTSLFFHREFNLKPLANRQPSPSRCAVQRVNDADD